MVGSMMVSAAKGGSNQPPPVRGKMGQWIELARCLGEMRGFFKVVKSLQASRPGRRGEDSRGGWPTCQADCMIILRPGSVEKPGSGVRGGQSLVRHVSSGRDRPLPDRKSPTSE